MTTANRVYTGFEGHRIFKRGPLGDVVLAARDLLGEDPNAPVAIYDDTTGVRLDIDYRGSADEVLARLADHPMVPQEEAARARQSGPGRPRLGVVSREVSLLPRHWEWLNYQRGGASGTLRRLVDEARRQSESHLMADRLVQSLDRFLWDMAGNFENFEEVTRAMYAGDHLLPTKLMEQWPEDIRGYVLERLRLINDFRNTTKKGMSS